MILALAGLKGGTGRTTLAISLAVEAIERGRRTLLIDLDPRGDAHAWAMSAEDRAPTTLALPGDAPGQPERLRGLSFGYDLTIIDTPNDPVALACVLTVADLVLVPCRPSPMDAWAAVDTLDAATLARAYNPRVQVAVVQNAVDPRTTIGAALPNDLAALGLPTLQLQICRRVIHAEAMAEGSTASLLDPRGPAAAEIGELLDTVEAVRARCSAPMHLRH